jgi:hypothetical protein
VRYRFLALLLTLPVAVSVAACGSSSKSNATSTAASPAVTQSTTTSTPSTQSTAASGAGPNAAVCAEATKDLQPLQAAASTGNKSQIVAQAGQAASKLTGLQTRPGISAQAHTALGQLTGALQAFAHGARDQATATQLTSGATNLAAACR